MSYLGTNEIGKMYLGSVEIAKAYLGDTLVYSQGGAPAPPGDLSRYIQDGLVMHLDGINKGETSGRWSSLVGTAYCALTTHSESKDDHVLMDGNGCLTVTNAVTTGYTSGTIEVVCDNIGGGNCIIYYGLSSKFAFIYSPNGYGFGIASSNNQWNITKETLFTASANADRFMLNGVAGGTKGTNSWTAVSSTTIGGRAGSASHYYANAKIYSIRIYSKKLTEAEMLNNQKVDNARFNLGLNI